MTIKKKALNIANSASKFLGVEFLTAKLDTLPDGKYLALMPHGGVQAVQRINGAWYTWDGNARMSHTPRGVIGVSAGQ